MVYHYNYLLMCDNLDEFIKIDSQRGRLGAVKAFILDHPEQIKGTNSFKGLVNFVC